MALRPPPEKQDSDKEKIIRNVVNKGGKSVSKEKWDMISLRLPKTLLDEIDNSMEQRIGLSRNAWILEAIQEKLKSNNR